MRGNFIRVCDCSDIGDHDGVFACLHAVPGHNSVSAFFHHKPACENMGGLGTQKGGKREKRRKGLVGFQIPIAELQFT